MKIIGLPKNANDYEFIVVRQLSSGFWFYDVYSNGFKATAAAERINGIVIHNLRIQGKR